MLSPYDVNPAGLNPLRPVLPRSVDFDRLDTAPIKLFVTATNVRTAREIITRVNEVSVSQSPEGAAHAADVGHQSTVDIEKLLDD